MKPFLILQLRPNSDAADGELQAILKFGGLNEDEVERVKMDEAGVPEFDLDDYSGIIVGGGPSNLSDKEEKKSVEQKRFEAELKKLLDKVVDRDFPFLGACYGFSAILSHQSGEISKEKYSEAVGGTTIILTEAGEKDDLLKDLPHEFRALCGHKEACQVLPQDVVLLATSELCPVQMVRLKNNIYGTQFHPELDVEGIVVRINVYKHAGYFPPEEAEPLIKRCREENIVVPPEILRRFVAKYRQ